MKLTYFRHDPPNFGDELNDGLWRHLLPEGFLDADETELFFGAGSILRTYPGTGMKHVAGSGYGGYSALPDIRDGTWNFLWVRGPLTAARLGLDPARAICDAAILLRETPLPPPEEGIGAAFMPHFESAARGDWAEVCARAGLAYLDPRDDPARLVARIRGARVVVTEAMHGAIVADALRTPWVPVLPFHPTHRMKWEDWAASLGLALRRERLPPSNLREAYVLATGLQGKGARSARLAQGRAVAPLNEALRDRAARRLIELAERTEPQLSADDAIGRATTRCREALDRFVRSRTEGKRALGA
jgi:succinoglycan biosynthesis protein ExoV